MPITTVDQIMANTHSTEQFYKVSFTAKQAGTNATTLYMGGYPAVATPPSGVGLDGVQLTSLAGAFPVPAPIVGKNIYLGGFGFAGAFGVGGCALIDRLWHNYISTVTTTTAQTINHPGLPARDQLGGTTGNGVLVALEVHTTTTGNSSAIQNTLINYTNDQGVTGRQATLGPFPATANPGTFIPFALQGPDTGVRSIQSITLGTSYVSGALSLVMYREMASVGCPYPGNFYAGPIELGMPRLFDNTVLQAVYNITATTVSQTQVNLTYLQG